MMDEGGPFAGSWTYDISPHDGGSRVVRTEVANFRNPLFRVMARVFGQTKYLDENLEDLAGKFGETASVGQRITVLRECAPSSYNFRDGASRHEEPANCGKLMLTNCEQFTTPHLNPSSDVSTPNAFGLGRPLAAIPKIQPKL